MSQAEFIPGPAVDRDNPEDMLEVAIRAGRRCILCHSKDVTALGEFTPNPEWKERYAPYGFNPSRIGSIWYALCGDCSSMDDYEIADAVEKQIREDVAKTKDVSKSTIAGFSTEKAGDE